ncbi:T9SS type A sorting domain-containing protein [Psychroflexus aestuariivivens]|uniref:T9SS type A sorting domain-containing protein n=1 Tax=Psychroflexus aestuariivivens TaxID=1795040 RepID=UPI000FD8FCC7|nr:T9SS type A sorting domain-containing protein [Psychroflexus aestuariivivens]
MNQKIFLITFFVAFTNMYSQNFLPSCEMIFETLVASSSDVGDYDNDGDLDIIIMGFNSGTNYTLVYNNDGTGNFTLSPITFNDNYRNGQVEFIDYDNDNDLDIFISGLVESGTSKSRLYQNNSNVFTEIPFAFADNIINNQFAWGDLDNDGDLDLLLMGNSEGFNEYAYLYRNDGNNNFTEMSQSFLPLSQGSIVFADIDNDGDNDIVTGGLNSPNFTSHLEIYENNGDFSFTFQTSLEGYFNGDLELRDFDGNGFIDVIKNGSTDTGDSTKMYLNTGSFIFNENTSIGLTSVGDFANIVSADYTGNGELDFLVSGRLQPYTQLLFSTSIFENSGNLSLAENTTTGILNNAFNAIEIGDFDNDHDTDIFVLESNVSNTYTNQSGIQNTIPNPPQNLSSSVTASDVVLNWSDSTDDESPANQLTYNIYVGTALGTTDVVSPMSNLNTGYRKVVSIGNSQYKGLAVLENLPNGTYYWAVQSIDNQYEGSLFSVEQTFTINNLSLDEFDNKIPVKYYPNPVDNRLNISSHQNIEKVTISSFTGQTVNTLLIDDLTSFYIDFTNFDSGIYFVSLFSSKGEDVIKVIKK